MAKGDSLMREHGAGPWTMHQAVSELLCRFSWVLIGARALFSPSGSLSMPVAYQWENGVCQLPVGLHFYNV